MAALIALTVCAQEVLLPFGYALRLVIMRSECLHLSHDGAVDRPLPAVPVKSPPAEIMGNEPDTVLHLNR